MPIDIVSSIQSMRSALDILGTLASAHQKIQTADLKLRIAELIDNVVDGKSALISLQSQNEELLSEIARLKEAYRTKGEVVRVGDAVVIKGSKSGEFWCLACYESSLKLHSLIRTDTVGNNYICTFCKTKYMAHGFLNFQTIESARMKESPSSQKST